MNLNLAISPCPNDTYIFHALLHGLIDHNFNFSVQYEDIKTLNALAKNGVFDIIKASYQTLAYVTDNYQILPSGSALGKGVGPLLISKNPINAQSLSNKIIAVPGLNTTANFLLDNAFNFPHTKEVLFFNEIEQAIIDNKVDAGVIIHENRFTYESKGLHKIIDLGQAWEDQTHCPIPLGGIAVRRELSQNVKSNLSALIRESIDFANAKPKLCEEYVQLHAQEMELAIIYQHIGLYVNDFSLNLGHIGTQAVAKMFKILTEKDPKLKLKKDYMLKF